LARLLEGFSHFVATMTAPDASGWSGRRVGLAATEKRRLSDGKRQKRPPRLFVAREIA
jgi:hypothetical protein